MRVLMVAVDFPALSETFVLDQITGLIDRGFDVDILAYRAREESAVHPDVDRYRLFERVQYVKRIAPTGRRIPRWARLLFGLALTGRLRLALEAMKLGWARAWRKPVFAGGLQLVAYARTLERLPEPNVVVCHFGPTGDLMIRLRRAFRANWPVATFFHGYDISSVLKEKGCGAYDHLLREGDMFLPASDFFRDRLVRMGAPAEITTVHRMGVSPAAQDPTPAVGRAPNSVSFVSVGRLVEKKGYEYLIRALSLCRQLAPELQMDLCIVGDGPLLGELRGIVGQLKLDERVEFSGSASREEVMRKLLAANAFVLPSITPESGDTEASPVAISEAMALGLPVISTYHGGIPEIVKHEVTGLLVAERDARGLAGAMIRIARDPGLSVRLGKAAREMVERELDRDRWNDALADRIVALAATPRSYRRGKALRARGRATLAHGGAAEEPGACADSPYRTANVK